MITTLANCKPYKQDLLGRNVFEDIFDSMLDLPSLMTKSTQGYPTVDIYKETDGDTVLEFALAGFSKEDLSIEIKPEKNSITVGACSSLKANPSQQRRIARRSFSKTYVDYDNNLDLASTVATYNDGLLKLVIPIKLESKPINIGIK